MYILQKSILLRKKTNPSFFEIKKIRNRFCSQKCNVHFNRGIPRKVKCDQCEKEFIKGNGEINKTKHNFCCHSCAAKFRNSHKITGSRRSKLEIWLSNKIPEIFPNIHIDFNKTSTINSELDIYIPSLKLAFELNGIFHYEPIFGKDKLKSIKNNDERKIQACNEKEISICIIDCSGMANFKILKAQKYLDIIVNIIKKSIENQLNESI